MNPIENVFNYVKTKLQSQALQQNITFENFDQFSARVKETLENVAVEYVNKTIDTTNPTPQLHGTASKQAKESKSITVPVTYIIGDSIIKEVKGWKLSNNLNREHKVVVKSFSGATTECINQYIKPSLKTKPNRIILHCGTNDLNSTKNAEEIAGSIISLALSSTSDNTVVSVSGIVARSDKFASKARDVNKFVQKLCQKRNICFISNNNISPTSHLNKSKLHLNKKGTKMLSRNFIHEIKK